MNKKENNIKILSNPSIEKEKLNELRILESRDPSVDALENYNIESEMFFLTYRKLPEIISQYDITELLHDLIDNYSTLAFREGAELLKRLEAVLEFYIHDCDSDPRRVKPLSDFQLPKQVVDWLATSVEKRGNLILRGPARTGKTELAKSILAELGMKYVVSSEVNLIRGMCLGYTLAILYKREDEVILILDTENPDKVRVLYGTIEEPSRMSFDYTRDEMNQVSTEEVFSRMSIIKIHKQLWVEETEDPNQ